MKKIIFLAFCFSLFAFTSKAQQQSRFNPDTIRTIVIDSVVNIRSHKLNAQDFIDAVLADTGFYKAFRDMKKYTFTAENYVYTFDKKNKIDGKIYRKLRHINNNGKYAVTYIAKSDSGNVYKKKRQIPVVYSEYVRLYFYQCLQVGARLGKPVSGYWRG